MVRAMATENLPPVERRRIEPTAEQLAVVNELDPDQPISGNDAYQRYGEAAQPLVPTTS